jgi:hypothetical protein
VIADQAVNHVERFIIEEGHTVQRLEKDYGYDLILMTFDEMGYVEPGLVWLQVKAKEKLQSGGSDYVFDMEVRDYNLWVLEDMPVILVLFDASRKRAYWSDIQAYFLEHKTRRPKQGADHVRVRIPKQQGVTRRAIKRMRELKRQARLRLVEEQA